MNNGPVISLVLNAHAPFVRHPETPLPPEEQWFFQALSETYLPLLAVFDRLDAEHIPFHLGISLSPTLCQMLVDEFLRDRYLEYMDKQIEFGAREIERTAGEPELRNLAKFFYDKQVDKRVLFTERYEGNILKIFNYYQKKGRLEILTTAATHAFLPFYVAYPEAIQAQLEVSIASYRFYFGKYPQGFWLPEFGWTRELGEYLRSYNFAYTMVETHGLVFGEPCANKGSFYPVKTPDGVFILGRDHYAGDHIAEIIREPVYRDNCQDAGYELPLELVRPFLASQGSRTQTGYKYWAKNGGAEAKIVYNPQKAAERVGAHVRSFLDARISRLRSAGEYMEGPPVSLCAFDAELFGRVWYEGPEFIEALFREGAERKEIQFMTSVEYLYKQDSSSFQTLTPEFSSWGTNGYGEMWIDASNDWMYRHLMRALERMIEIAERFPDDSGLKERTLNQAAREILLVQASDWAKMLSKQESPEYARSQIETALRNFTTIYEALGKNYISTEWLTNLERRHKIFPHINYRIFRPKKYGLKVKAL
jgi:1,4-alpha-glucan branching enzyme